MKENRNREYLLEKEENKYKIEERERIKENI